MIIGILSAFSLLALSFGAYFLKDLSANKNNLEKETNIPITASIGFVTLFFDTLGIGCFAPMTMLLRLFKQIKDRVIPGTLNVSCAIPVIIEAVIFITVIEVDEITLITMVIAAILGSAVGAGYVAKLPEKKIQLIIGIALLATAFFMFTNQLGWISKLGTGEAIGLSGGKLLFACLANFVLGALQAAGIGMYAPVMALVYLLGLSPKVTFPIMMSSGAIALVPASFKFIKEGAYNRKASLVMMVAGIGGVFIAAFIVKSLPARSLIWVVICAVVYTSFTLLYSAMKKNK